MSPSDARKLLARLDREYARIRQRDQAYWAADRQANLMRESGIRVFGAPGGTRMIVF